MFHLIFPFTQSTSNWCQLFAAVGLLYAPRRRCRWWLPDATRTWLTGAARSAGVRLRLRLGSARLGTCFALFLWEARARLRSNVGHADWPLAGRLGNCFGFSLRLSSGGELCVCEEGLLWRPPPLGNRPGCHCRCGKFQFIFVFLFVCVFFFI